MRLELEGKSLSRKLKFLGFIELALVVRDFASFGGSTLTKGVYSPTTL